MTENDKRLIEDYLPIQAISAEASREKAPRKGHISTLHLWWARRPLVASRAAVYGALVPASRFIPEVNLKVPPKDPDVATRRKEGTAKGLGRGAASQFVERLCKYPGVAAAVAEAQKHILEAHADRLTQEIGKIVTAEDITTGRAPRPRVLDMFAGGGAIPLEALRLGCDVYALDLNPVAHIIELCTLVFPQKYGKPDLGDLGMTGPKNREGKNTWGGLAGEIRYWGKWVVERVRQEIGDLYPLIPDPKFTRADVVCQADMWRAAKNGEVLPGFLVPVAYLWTRTVRCKNPSCGATVPLLKQTWLSKKKGRYVALKVVAPRDKKEVQFQIAEAASEAGLGFDPAAGSEGGNATCPFCRAVADSHYVQSEGAAGRVGFQHLAFVCRRPKRSGTEFLQSKDVLDPALPAEGEIRERISQLIARSGLSLPDELINSSRPSPNARGLSAPTRHGLTKFSDLFHPRQLLSLLAQCAAVRTAFTAMRAEGLSEERAKVLTTYLGILVDRMADRGSSMCRWDPGYTKTQSTFGRPALSFVWDFSETNPFGDASGDMAQAIDWIASVVEEVASITNPAVVERGSALRLHQANASIDAIVTDPPYYDNVPYGDLSDFFYVWLKRAIGNLYPEHFSSDLTPKKSEATALSSRFGGDMGAASSAYEEMMLTAFKEAGRVLKPGGPLVVVYAHKTTLGWSTLVDALRQAGFIVTEAWPLNTEFGGRLMSQDSAALASSIFLVARRRDRDEKGSYEKDVREQLDAIVRERVATLWDLGISGADLVIACVGAGLRAFTRFARVEFANGEEVPAGRFLTEVETAVLESILGRLSKEVGGNGGKHSLAGVDSPTRFYTLWRYTYRAADLDAGEAIVFANGTHVELDGVGGLAAGPRPLIQKKKGQYRLRDYSERGEDEKLGLPQEHGEPAPLVDTLHRTLWLMEHRPGKLAEFLREAQPNREQMRLVAQALAGPALRGGELSDVSSNAELSALAKLTANWHSLVEEASMTPAERDARTTGQNTLDFGKEGRR